MGLFYVLSMMCLILLSTAASAASPCSPTAQSPVTLDPELLKAVEKAAQVRKEKAWFSASANEVLQSRCSRRAPFSKKEMSDWLDLKTKESGPGVNATIHGIQLVDESPFLADLLQALLTNDEGSREPQKTYNSRCKKVYCVVKELFGEKVGLQLLYMKGRFGYNGSHLRVKRADPWTSEELDSVLLSLSDLPQGLLASHPGAFNRKLTHFKRGHGMAVYGNDQPMANAMIDVFDRWNRKSAAEKRYALFHEFGHNVASELRIDHSASWHLASGWIEHQGEWHLPNTDKAVSKYAEDNPTEAFAESFAAYRYNPDKLKSLNPEVYGFLKAKIFNHVEFTVDGACSDHAASLMPLPASNEN